MSQDPEYQTTQYGYVLDDPINLTDPLGLDALFIVGRNKKNPAFFQRQAEINARAYEQANPGQKAFVVEAYDFASFQDALSTHKNIDRLDYWGHGGVGGLFLGDSGKGVYVGNVAQLPTQNILPGAHINLVSCYSAAGGEKSIAQAFANHFNASVSGFTSVADFGLYDGGIFDPLNGIPRGDAQTRSPGQKGLGSSTSTFPGFLPDWYTKRGQ